MEAYFCSGSLHSMRREIRSRNLVCLLRFSHNYITIYDANDSYSLIYAHAQWIQPARFALVTRHSP